MIPTFTSTDKFVVGDRLIFIAKLDRKTTNFEHIIGKQIQIDGELYTGIDVNHYANVPPWGEGSPIAIVVQK